MQTYHLNRYILISIIIHILFLISLKNTFVKQDISQIGEQGMQIQMVLIQDKVDDTQEDESILSKEKEILKEIEQEQQAIFDNRIQGDKAKKIYQSYYGVIRNILDSNKKYPLLYSTLPFFLDRSLVVVASNFIYLFSSIPINFSIANVTNS